MKLCFEVKDRHEFDIVIVGGGTTGVAAAIAAARGGARTALIESHGFLGGNAATGLAWLGFHSRAGEKVVGGIAQELLDRLREVDGATDFYLDPIVGSLAGVNAHWWKLVATEAVKQAGVDVFLHALVVGLEMGDPASGSEARIEGVYIQGREGIHFIRARTFVDCTDSGAIAGYAGATRIRGRASDAKVQVASWTFQVGGVDFSRLIQYFKERPDELRPFELLETEMNRLLWQMERAEVFVMGAFKELVSQAKAEGLELPRENVPGIAHRRERMLTVVATRVEDADPDNLRTFSAAEMEGSRQARLWMEFFEKYVPGCEEIYLCGTPHQIGIRETNHVVGDYLLTGDDLMEGRNFHDKIALGAYHLDVHSPDHGGIETRMCPVYQIPYRCLIPKGIDNLFLAGRPISATHEAMASTRVIPIGMAMGQAAGTAARLSLATNGRSREVDVRRLQEILRDQGAILEVDGVSLTMEEPHPEFYETEKN